MRERLLLTSSAAIEMIEIYDTNIAIIVVVTVKSSCFRIRESSIGISASFDRSMPLSHYFKTDINLHMFFSRWGGIANRWRRSGRRWSRLVCIDSLKRYSMIIIQCSNAQTKVSYCDVKALPFCCT